MSKSKNYICKEVLMAWGNFPAIMLSEKKKAGHQIVYSLCTQLWKKMNRKGRSKS